MAVAGIITGSGMLNGRLFLTAIRTGDARCPEAAAVSRHSR